MQLADLEVLINPALTSVTTLAAAREAPPERGRNDQTSEQSPSRGSSRHTSRAARPCYQHGTRSEAVVSDFSGRNMIACTKLGISCWQVG